MDGMEWGLRKCVLLVCTVRASQRLIAFLGIGHVYLRAVHYLMTCLFSFLFGIPDFKKIVVLVKFHVPVLVPGSTRMPSVLEEINYLSPIDTHTVLLSTSVKRKGERHVLRHVILKLVNGL